MSDSPIESTKGLHESKERKPVDTSPDAIFFGKSRVALPRGAEPETPIAQRYRKSGERVQKLPLEIVGTEYEMIEKINELVDRVNQLNGWRNAESD